MKPSFEKLVPPVGESFRCFDRRVLRSSVRWHRHPEIELTYVKRGSGSRLVGDHIGSYGNHDLVLLGSQLPHTWSSDEHRGKKHDRHSAIVLQFHPDFLGSHFFAVSEMATVEHLLQQAKRGIWYPPAVAAQVGARMHALVEQSGVARIIGLLSCLNELTETRDGEFLASETYCLNTNPESETRIQTVCDHIARHLSNSELCHKTLADLVHMNPSAFSRFFRQSTGRTVTAHITELRIGLACRLLTVTDDSVLKISTEAGFANLSNFNRQFRRLRGKTPREYRNKFQAAQGN